jgi:hypothetical protein
MGGCIGTSLVAVYERLEYLYFLRLIAPTLLVLVLVVVVALRVLVTCSLPASVFLFHGI